MGTAVVATVFATVTLLNEVACALRGVATARTEITSNAWNGERGVRSRMTDNIAENVGLNLQIRLV